MEPPFGICVSYGGLFGKQVTQYENRCRVIVPKKVFVDDHMILLVSDRVDNAICLVVGELNGKIRHGGGLRCGAALNSPSKNKAPARKGSKEDRTTPLQGVGTSFFPGQCFVV